MPFTLEQYLSLITAEHNQRPRFMATVEIAAQPGVDAGNLAESLIGLFDLDTAVGEQLDFLGEWVGVARYITGPLDVWFSLDTPGLGLDQGKWQSPYELSNQTIRLDDVHYRILLRARIVANYWDGTIAGAYEAWNLLFRDTGYQILIQDGMGRAEHLFTLDSTPSDGLDHGLWYSEPALADIYFTLDSDRPELGLDQGYILGPPGSALTQPVARTHGNMHILQALLGAPIDAVIRALFAGGYLGLKSAGVAVDYMIQWQEPPPTEPDLPSGIGLPLFGLDAGPGDPGGWMSFDNPDLGLDAALLFHPGGHPGEVVSERPPYLVLDSTDPAHQLDASNLFTPGLWPAYDPSNPPPTGVTWPPTPIAGLDLGMWGEMIPAQ
jgi:hypothetical protein